MSAMTAQQVRNVRNAGWEPTAELRWYRPPRATDDAKVLQQKWKAEYGEDLWITVETVLAD